MKEKWDKELDDLRIKDVVKRWNKIEKIIGAEGTMLLKHTTDGCVEVCWLLPNDLVEDAIRLATSNEPPESGDQSTTNHQTFFTESLVLKIGDHVIKDSITSKLLTVYISAKLDHFSIM